MRTTSYRLMDWLPDYLMGIVRRRLLELCGLAIILLAALAAIALATWSAADPSMSHAADRPVHNLLGRPGAAFADFMLQMLGAASLAVVLPLAIWGWWVMTHRTPERLRVRIPAFALGIVLAAGFTACIAPTASWPLSSGLGGVAGDAIMRVVERVFGDLVAGWGRIGAAAILAALIAFIQALIERLVGPAIAGGLIYVVLLIVLAVRPEGMFGAATQRRA